MFKIPYPILLLPSHEQENPEAHSVIIRHYLEMDTRDTLQVSAIEAYYASCLQYVHDDLSKNGILNLYPRSAQKNGATNFKDAAKFPINDIFRTIIAGILDKIQFEQAKWLLVNMVRQRDKVQKALYQPNAPYFEAFTPVSEPVHIVSSAIPDRPSSSGIYPQPICSKRISMMDILHQVNLSILQQSILNKPNRVPAFKNFHLDAANTWVVHLKAAYTDVTQFDIS